MITLNNKSYSYNTSNCSVDIDLSRFEENLKDAQVALNLDIMSDTEPYVRYDTGRLNTESLDRNINNSEGAIIYYALNDDLEPYAYKTYNSTNTKVTKDVHPLARPLWFEYSKSLNKEKWIAHVKKVAGGGNNAK